MPHLVLEHARRDREHGIGKCRNAPLPPKPGIFDCLKNGVVLTKPDLMQ